MGRLTLNVLLSFAQFEREAIGERVRDKIAASKRKGIWVGGPVPLGYRSVAKKLVVVEEEAGQVRTIFRRYLALGSIGLLVVDLHQRGVWPKATVRDGALIQSTHFMVGPLAHILPISQKSMRPPCRRKTGYGFVDTCLSFLRKPVPAARHDDRFADLGDEHRHGLYDLPHAWNAQTCVALSGHEQGRNLHFRPGKRHLELPVAIEIADQRCPTPRTRVYAASVWGLCRTLDGLSRRCRCGRSFGRLCRRGRARSGAETLLWYPPDPAKRFAHRKAYDGVTTTLAETAFDWSFETSYQFEIEVDGRRIGCKIGATELIAHDADQRALDDGGIALVVCEGASSSNNIRVSPLQDQTLADAHAA
jgi:hypothetical protein